MILDVQDLSFRYSKNTKPIFHNVNLQMEKGEILTILGANGAGKSTLLNCLANILEPYSGKILVNGASIHDMRLKKAAQLIGYVPQNHAPVYDYSVRDFIVMGRAPHLGMLEKPSENDYAIVDEVIRELGIEKLADKAYTQISGGERQQALIGRAIAQQPEIIMFDELVEIICNYVDVQPADVHEESRFMEDLGFTSFDFMSMLGEIEDTFDVEIEQTKAAEIRTVQEAVDYLETLKDA